MSKTNIPIEKIVEEKNLFNTLFSIKTGGFFIMGVLSSFSLGVFSSSYINFPIVLPFSSAKDNVAAIGAVGENSVGALDTSHIDSISNDILVPETSNPDGDAFVDEALVDVPFTPLPTVRINALNELIERYDLEIGRKNDELQRIKDQSVLLIADFNQNCGSWNDACAISYADQLEIKNTRYAELVREIAFLTEALSASQYERIDLLTE